MLCPPTRLQLTLVGNKNWHVTDECVKELVADGLQPFRSATVRIKVPIELPHTLVAQGDESPYLQPAYADHPYYSTLRQKMRKVAVADDG